MRILILEDDHQLRDILTAFLEMKGHEVQAAVDPTRCRICDPQAESCQRAHPCVDAILVDQNMPNMTGLEFLARQEAKGCRLPGDRKAIVSSHLDQEKRTQAAKFGCATFSKPCSMLTLLEWLANIERDLAGKRQHLDFL